MFTVSRQDFPLPRVTKAVREKWCLAKELQCERAAVDSTLPLSFLYAGAGTHWPLSFLYAGPGTHKAASHSAPTSHRPGRWRMRRSTGTLGRGSCQQVKSSHVPFQPMTHAY